MKKRILVSVIVVLLFAAFLGVGTILKMNSNQKYPVASSEVADKEETSQTGETDSTKQVDASESENSGEQPDKSDSEKTETSDNKEQAAQPISLTYNASNSWQEDGATCTQYDVTICNNTETDQSDWKVDLAVPEQAELVQKWNASISIKKGKMTAQPVEYNSILRSGEEVTYGFILKTQSDYAPKESGITVDGNYYAMSGQSTDVASETAQSKDANQEETGQTDAVAEPDQTDGKKVLTGVAYEKNPVKKHGKLSVKGTKIVDKNGKAFQLRGISTHGIAWFPQYVNRNSFASLKELMHINAIRLAMYSDPNAGYTKKLHEKVKQGVDAATKEGLYAIIDWHILNDNNPNQYKSQAKAFFKEMARTYKNQNNVIYEICNEPNGNVTWQKDIKPYAKELIKTIRKIDKDAIIIVGTPTWSQDVDIVADDPITGSKNIMYAFHFYAATHKDDLRKRVETALQKGLPVFISEFSICEASGNGSIDKNSAKQWMKLADKYKISMMAWNLSNKDEKSSLLKPGCTKTGNYKKSDLSETGLWLYKQYR